MRVRCLRLETFSLNINCINTIEYLASLLMCKKQNLYILFIYYIFLIFKLGKLGSCSSDSLMCKHSLCCVLCAMVSAVSRRASSLVVVVCICDPTSEQRRINKKIQVSSSASELLFIILEHELITAWQHFFSFLD